MRKLTYYAVFESSTNGTYGVYWPDLPGCVSMGDNLPHAERMAAEALSLHIYGMEQDGDVLPTATLPPFEEMPEGGIVMPVTIFPDIVKNEFDNRAVKTNITLPAWLKDWAGTQGINLSQTLQTALKQMYDAHHLMKLAGWSSVKERGELHMNRFIQAFKEQLGNNVIEAYCVVNEYEVWVSSANHYQKIKVKVLRDLGNVYSYKLSHHYHGSKQLAPYVSSVNRFDSELDAIYGAKREMLSFFEPNDENAEWVENKQY